MVYSVYILGIKGFYKIRELTNKQDAQNVLDRYVTTLKEKPIFIRYLKNNPTAKLGYIKREK